MGCDGGSIPRRAEMVKIKAKNENINETEDVIKTQWTCCFISKTPLENPIVACKLGRLYNKESVVKYLLSKNEGIDLSLANELSHIKSLKNSVINCNIKAKEGNSEYFVCPISGREMNGKCRFYVSRTCGCIISEAAINQFPDTNTCLVCEASWFREDLIPLYPKGERLTSSVLAFDDPSRKRREFSSLKLEDSAVKLLSEIKANKSEIGTLKKTKVTETLYIKK